jgi:hypothetical protein
MTDTPSFAPTQADPLAAVRLCWDALLEGQAQDEDLLHTLQAYSDRINGQLNQLEAQVFQGASDPKDPLFAALVDALERQLAGVERMAQEIDDPEQGHMEVGFEMAQRAHNAAVAAQTHLSERPEPPAQLNCPFCGASQRRGAERCVQCGRVLPGMFDRPSSFSVIQSDGISGTQSGRAMTADARQLTQSVQAWRNGKLTWEQLYTVLDDIEDKLMNQQDRNAEAVVREGDAQGLLGRTHEALEDSLEALDHMRMAWDENEESYLELGQNRFLEASDALLQLKELV